MAKTRTKQGRSKRGTTKTMKKAARERVNNPVRERKFLGKTESTRPLPGEPAKGPRKIGRVNRVGARGKKAARATAK